MAATLVVRVAANLDQFKANLQEGLSQIETTASALTRMSSAYDGSKILQQAGATAAAIQNIGGVSKLTTDEQTRALTVIDQALDKYKQLGRDAPAGLQAMADSMRGNKTAWESFVGGFNVKEAISDPLGTAQAAALVFTEALGPVGLGITAVTAIAGAFAKVAFDMADKAGLSGERLYDLSLKTGMAIEPLSKISKAATIAGADVEQVGTAMFMFGKNTEEHGDKVAKGLDKIGLSLSEIKKLSPDQQFLAIADALTKIPDPMQRNAAASELFGRAARDLMPLLMEINDAMDRTKNMSGWTTNQAKDAKEFEMDLRQLKLQVDAVEMGIGKQLLPAAKELANFATDHAGVLKLFLGPIDKIVSDFMLVELAAKRILGMTPPTVIPNVKSPAGFGAADTGAIDQAKAMADEEVAAARLEARLSGLASATAALTTQQMANIDTLHKLGASDKEIAELVRTSVDAVHAYIESEKELAKQQAETDAVLLGSYERRVTGLKNVTDANLKAYSFDGQIANLQQLMAAEETLARTVYGQLTSEKDRAKVIEELGLRRVEITNQIMTLERQHAGAVNAQVIAELEARGKLLRSQGQNIDGTTYEKTALDKLNDAIDALRRNQVAGISTYERETLLIKEYTDEEYKRVTAEEAAAAATQKATDALKAKADAMKVVANAGVLSLDVAKAYGSEYAASLDKLALTPGSMLGLSKGTMTPSTMSIFDMRIPGHDYVGPATAGQPYYIGKGAQPELFVPETNGMMYPAGAGGGETHIHIYVTQPLGTPQQIADVVGPALLAKWRGQGNRIVSGV